MLYLYIALGLLIISPIPVIFAVCRNMRANGEIEKELNTKNGIIKSQKKDEIYRFRVGLYPASHNGCEIIALHNALVLMDKAKGFDEEIALFQKHGAVIGAGAFGSNPYLLGRVMKRQGIPFTKVSHDEVYGKGIYIVSYWNYKPPFHGLHTVTVKTDDNSVNMFNCSTPYCHIPEKRIICIYKLQ